VDLMAHLRPDVLIGQSVCDVCAVGEGELARVVATLMPTPWVVTLHAHTLDQVLLDIGKVGEALELRDEAEELDAGMRYRRPSVRPSPTRRRGRCSGDASSFSTAMRILRDRDPASWTRLRRLPG